VGRLIRSAQSNNVHAIAALDQSRRVLLNARVRLVERVREHADFQGLTLRTCGGWHMGGEECRVTVLPAEAVLRLLVSGGRKGR
jgi:hypothetical protein